MRVRLRVKIEFHKSFLSKYYKSVIISPKTYKLRRIYTSYIFTLFQLSILAHLHFANSPKFHIKRRNEHDGGFERVIN